MNYCHFTLNYSKLSIFTLSYLNYCFELCGQGHSSMLIAGINIYAGSLLIPGYNKILASLNHFPILQSLFTSTTGGIIKLSKTGNESYYY